MLMACCKHNSMKHEVRANKRTRRAPSAFSHVPHGVMSQYHHHHHQLSIDITACRSCSDCATCWMMRDSNPGNDKIVLSGVEPTSCSMGKRSPYNRPRRAHRGSRGIALLILDLGARRGWVLLNGYRVQNLGQSGQGMKFAKSLHLLPRLRTSGAVPLLPLRVFMACLSISTCVLLPW
jgi:hypothetical protein